LFNNLEFSGPTAALRQVRLEQVALDPVSSSLTIFKDGVSFWARYSNVWLPSLWLFSCRK